MSSDGFEEYFLITTKPEEDLPQIKIHTNEFFWEKHPSRENTWRIKTIFSDQGMWKLVYGPGSLMCQGIDILYQEVVRRRVDPESFGTLYG